MQSGRLWRLLAVAVLAVAILAAVAVLAPGRRDAPDPGIATTSTAPAEVPAAVLPEPCVLLTAGDIEMVLDIPVMPTQQSAVSCTYAGDGETPVTVRVDVRAAPEGVDDLLRQREDAIRSFGAGAVVDMEDLGDAAFMTDTRTGLVAIQVVSGRVAIIIALAGPVDDPATAVRALAGPAASRM